jgi:hypothetical protein
MFSAFSNPAGEPLRTADRLISCLASIRKDFDAAPEQVALKSLRGHAKFLSPSNFPASGTLFSPQ